MPGRRRRPTGRLVRERNVGRHAANAVGLSGVANSGRGARKAPPPAHRPCRKVLLPSSRSSSALLRLCERRCLNGATLVPLLGAARAIAALKPHSGTAGLAAALVAVIDQRAAHPDPLPLGLPWPCYKPSLAAGSDRHPDLGCALWRPSMSTQQWTAFRGTLNRRLGFRIGQWHMLSRAVDAHGRSSTAEITSPAEARNSPTVQRYLSSFTVQE